MNYIVIGILIVLLILCLCYLCYPVMKEGFTSTSNKGTSATKKNFKTLALYHGGCAGCGYFSEDQWKKYCAAYWSFVRYAGINKAMFNLTNAGAKDDGTGLRHGDNILKYWIGSMPSDLKSSVKIGFTAYPSAKSPWTWDCSLDGQMPGDCQPTWDYTKKKASSACCPGYAAGGAGGHTLIGTKEDGCPNNWEQIMNYIAYVNAKATPKISFMVVDGEGEGGYTIDKAGFCPIISAIAHAKKKGDVPADFTIGVAHGKGNFCSGGKYKSDKYKSSCQAIGTDDAYPEIYWYGELTDCAKAIKTMGSPAGYNSSACTSTIYQKYINQPQELLKAITDSSTPAGKFLGGAISEGIDGTYRGLPMNVYKYPETYPMFSTENINAQQGTKCATALNPKGGKKQCCVANYFYGESNSCGSFNGFGNWEFDKFMEFMNLWSKKFGSQSIAIYEWAFIPTAWIPNFDKIMGGSSSSLPSGPTPKGGTASSAASGTTAGGGAKSGTTAGGGAKSGGGSGPGTGSGGGGGTTGGAGKTCPLGCSPIMGGGGGGTSGAANQSCPTGCFPITGGSGTGSGAHGTGTGAGAGSGAHGAGAGSGAHGAGAGSGAHGAGTGAGAGSGAHGTGTGAGAGSGAHGAGAGSGAHGAGAGSGAHGAGAGSGTHGAGTGAGGGGEVYVPPAPPGGPKGTLFLYPESGGFQIKDLPNGFQLDPKVITDNFHTIAVVANHAGNFVSQWNDPYVTQLQSSTGLPVVKWLAYYFGSDSAWACVCNAKGCVSSGMTVRPQSCSDCTNTVLAQVTKDVQQYSISGILFDDEVGNPNCIVKAMEQAKDKFPSLQLGWTKSLGTAKLASPGNLGTAGKWDVCLGQAYTDMTTDLYSGSCKFATDFWSQVASKFDQSVPANRGVPMVCGAGNCVGDDKKCIDERADGKEISKILAARPPPSQFKWRNFAIWYGTYDGKSFVPGCPDVGLVCGT